VREAARFGADDAEMVILEIDQTAFAVGQFDTQVNVPLLRDWPELVRLSGRGTDPGAALCEVLAGRTVHTVPADRGQALIARLLPAGCPVVR
jgi:hypothetical protein